MITTIQIIWVLIIVYKANVLVILQSKIVSQSIKISSWADISKHLFVRIRDNTSCILCIVGPICVVNKIVILITCKVAHFGLLVILVKLIAMPKKFIRKFLVCIGD